MGHLGFRKGPYRDAIQAVSDCEKGHSAMRCGGCVKMGGRGWCFSCIFATNGCWQSPYICTSAATGGRRCLLQGAFVQQKKPLAVMSQKGMSANGFSLGRAVSSGLLPALLDYAVAVGIEQLFQGGDLAFLFGSAGSDGHEHSVCRHFDNLCGALYVCSLFDGICRTGERLVLHELESAAVVP